MAKQFGYTKHYRPDKLLEELQNWPGTVISWQIVAIGSTMTLFVEYEEEVADDKSTE